MKLQIQKQTHVKSGTYINKDSVDVVGAVVALEGGDVRTEVVGWKKKNIDARFSRLIVIIIILVIIIMITWDDEDVSILVSVVGTMPGCAVADGEPGSLVADQLQRYLVFGIQYSVFVKRGRRPKRRHGSKNGGSRTTIMSIRVACFFLNIKHALWWPPRAMRLHQFGPLYLEWEGWKQCFRSNASKLPNCSKRPKGKWM